MKSFTFRLNYVLTLSLLVLSMGAKAQWTYSVNYMQNAGNPGCLVTTDILAGTNIIPQSQASNSWSAPQTIPFPFDFAGTPVTQWKVSGNGVVTFDLGMALPGSNDALPSAQLSPMTIAGMWDSFTTSPPTGTNDYVRVTTVGTAPNRQQWIFYYSYEIGSPVVSFHYWAIVLEETTNKIYVVDQYSTSSAFVSSTVGVQIDATTATMWPSSPNTPQSGNGSSLTADNDYWVFQPILMTACAGAPTVPPISSSVPFVTNTTTNVNLSFTSTLPLISTTGLSYQWQSSLDGISYTNITGETGLTLSTTIAATTYFQCAVTCANGGAVTNSNAVQVLLAPPPSITVNSVTPISCTSSLAHTVSAEILVGSGTFSAPSTFTYSYDGGVTNTSATITNTTGNTYTADIPAATPVNAPVSWTISATNSYGLVTTLSGSYQDSPTLGLSLAAVATPSTICAGESTVLNAVISPVAAYTDAPVSSTGDEDIGNVTIINANGDTLLNNTSALLSLDGTVGTATGIAGRYSNFAALTNIPMVAGSTYNFSISSIDLGFFYNNSLAIFIDYNKDGDFTDAGEMVYQPPAVINGPHTSTGSFTVPSWVSGTMRMRVVCLETLITSYATTSSWGEREDYTITVASGVTWFAGTTNVGTGVSLTQAPTATTDYTCEVMAGICPITSSIATVVVNAVPAAPIATNSTQCGSQVPTASVASTAGVDGTGMFYWYDAATAGNVVQFPPGSTTYTSVLANDATFYVSELGTNGCYSAATPISIAVSQPAAIDFANSASAICIGESVTLNMSSVIVPPYTYTVTSPNAASGLTGSVTGTTHTFTPTASGTMSYIVTAANGNCTEVDTVDIAVVPTASPAPIIAMDTISICPSATSAAFTAANSAMDVNYTFNLFDSFGDGWNGNTLQVFFNGVLANTLTITTGTNFSTTINVPEGTTITTAWTLGSWLEECSFNIVVGGATVHTGVMTTAAAIPSQMFTGSVPAYNYTIQWYNAATGGTLLGTGATFETIGSSVLPNLNTAGQYTVYAVQSNACLSPATPAIVNVTNVLADIVAIDATCNSVANGSFSVGTITCGTTPFTFSVDGGAFGAIPTNLAFGNHTVVIQDATGAVAPAVSFFVDQPTWIANVPNFVANGWACKDETSEIISAANPNLTISDTLVIQTAAVVPASGIFTITSTLNIPIGATVTSATLLVNGLTTIGGTWANDLDVTVSGIGSLSVTPSGNTVTNANYSYPLSGVNGANASVTVSIVNNWFGTATIASLALAYEYTLQQTLDNITWYAAPVGGQTLGSGFTLESVGTTVLPNTTVPGVYNFYAQGELDGCSSFTRLLVPVTIQAPTIVANMQTATVCPGDFLTLNGSGGLTYTWNNAVVNDMPFVPAPTSYVSATQTYVVNGFDIDGCANQDTVVVTVLPQPVLIAGVDQTVCEGTPIILNASTTTASPTPVTSFVWNNNILNNAQYVPTVSGPITVTANGANGCTTQDSVQISVLALPIVNAGVDQTICAGTGATLSASGAVSYVWNNNVSQGVTFYPTASQIYTVTGIGANGCTNVDQVQVNVATGPSVTVSAPQTVCSNDAATFSAVSQNSLGGFWTTSGNGTITPSISSAAITYLPAANDPVVVTLTYVATSACGNSSSTTNVNVLPIPVVDAGPDQTICSGSSVVLNAAGTGNITWGTSNVNNGFAFVPVSTATYTATATGLNNCTNQDEVTVTVVAIPDVDAGDDLTICSGEQVTLTASGATAYQWTGGIANGTPFAPGTTATYTVTGTTVNGCAGTDQVIVTVNATPEAIASIVDDVTLTATPGDYNYQWINCATGEAVPNASFATFNASANGTYAVIVSTPQGCSDKSDCITIDAVSVEQITEIAMSVQPNPTSGELSISMPTDLTAQAQVFDAQGKLVIDFTNVSNGSSLNLTNMTTGVYMIRISAADSVQTFRVVKQ